ncbi:ribonuclease P protein subunit [Candidatus Woesearchaeota archaeon]|nr:ribonuclease P protein subunit [Candidatus Woesearchaeota archaeon]
MVTIRKELIGSEVKLPYRAISGKILDETRDTFTIKVPGMRKKVLKRGNTFEFILDEKSVTAEGHELAARPEDRIKL